MKIECTATTPWGIHPTLVDLQCPRCGWAVERSAPAVRMGFFASTARRLRAFAANPSRRAA
jgi:hypothetical protein